MNINRHAAGKKSTTGKKGTRKKTAGKTTKKAAKKAARRPASAPAKASGIPKIDPEHRRRMIAETAYFIAEQRGFVGGSPLDDWLQAEVLVDRLLEKEQGRA